MYLSNLEIIGFKSFAQKTQFKFTEGMTALVGPNGCGKTNIVDALRWALGEQKTSVLRSDNMENVIFNGTNKRKPLGMAEVSLVIQNNKNVLPTEYNEVKITRRLFRNGESNYLLNNTKCRLRDITDLIMDTGMGPDSYSVIELKMVEAILSGKPEERRHLFEEAAGVTKYKIRRKEASRKLESVQSDLVRVEDIVQEVRKNVNSLSRQAAKTRRYNKLMDEHKELETDLLKHEYHKFNIDLEKYSDMLSALQRRRAESENEIRLNEETIQVLKNELSSLDEQYQHARDRESRIKSQIAQKTQDIAVFREKVSASGDNRERINKELVEIADALEQNIKNTEAANEKIQVLNGSKTEADTKLNDLKEKRYEAASAVSDLREETNISNESLINLQNRLNSLKAEQNRIERQKVIIENRIEESESEIEKLNQSIEGIDAKRGEGFKLSKTFDEKIAVEESALQLAQERQTILQNKIEAIQDKTTEKKSSLSRKTASLDFLKSLIDSGESAKFLINSEEWNPGADKILLAEAVGADEKFRVAVESCLGESAKYFVVDSRKDALSAFSMLKRKDKGKSAFISREDIPEIQAPTEIEIKGNDFDKSKSLKENGIYGWASEITRVDDGLRNALRGILGKTAIVNNLDIALKTVNSGIADAAVTLDGELVNSKGVLKGGSTSGTEGLAVGKRERIDNLSDEIWRLNKEITTLADELRAVRGEYNAIDIRNLNEQVRRAEAEKNQHERGLSELEFRKEALNNNLGLHNSNLARFSEEIAELTQTLSNSDNEINEIEHQLLLAKEERQGRLNEVAKAEEQFRNWEEAARLAEMESVQQEAEISNLEKDLERYARRKSYYVKRTEDLNRELTQNDDNKSKLETDINKFEFELEEVKKDAGEAQSSREYLAEQKKMKAEEIDQHSEGLELSRKQFEKHTESIHQTDIKASELKTEMNHILTRAREGLEIELDILEFEPDDAFSIADSKASLSELKDKLRVIGNVNFMALEEYETQNQRLVFYEEQVKDLTESEKTLRETIEEINQTAEEKFYKTFDEVHRNFQHLFSKLFNGEGEASLKLGEGNPLETNIEIMAKPPNKKPNSIEALSSGEKTLTAIALLFAIYLVKPSPFCILDEVDAPLDDANIDKFLDLIRDFSKDTQFMIVSHNKRTMAAADTLYGITQQEEGVSKVVSVRLS